MLLESASAFSVQVDRIFLAAFAAAVAILLGITAAIVYFTVRYSRGRNPSPTDIEGHFWLEAAWTAIPTAVFLVLFYFGWTSFREMRNPPADAMAVKVVGKQWSWSFQYPDGRWSSELYAALGRPLKLELQSADVIHGFFIPAFRVKSDVVPGKSNYLWFTPSLLGAFDIECTVICGVSHTYMLSKVRVLSEEDFKAWYFRDDDAPTPDPRQTLPRLSRIGEKGVRPQDRPGEALRDRALAVLNKEQCLACHSLDGAPMVGPTFLGLYGSTQTVSTEGKPRRVKADAAYLRRAIQEPGADIAQGYPPSMPDMPLSEPELDLIIGYLKTLKAPARKAP